VLDAGAAQQYRSDVGRSGEPAQCQLGERDPGAIGNGGQT
jgi:hypothetical protein